jgi:predicted helicase
LETAEEKREFLGNAKIERITFEEIRPDDKSNWINQAHNDFDSLIPAISLQAKATNRTSQEKALFKLYSNGVVTARDDWMTDFSETSLKSKVEHFCAVYGREQVRWENSGIKTAPKNKAEMALALRDFVSREIKWTEELEAHLDRGTKLSFRQEHLRHSAYRPFVSTYTYYARALTHRLYQQDLIFPIEGEWANLAIGFSGLSSSKPFQVLVVDKLPSFDCLEKTQFLPLYRYDGHGARIDNITDWALDQFKKQYQPGRAKPKRPITKEAIFHYVYGVLHNPAYHEKYALNLKREFPRIPFYADFWQWADWGKALMDLHIGYETVEPFELERIEAGPSPQPSARKRGEGAAERSEAPKAMLKADREAGRIVLDSQTALSGVPPEAWDYRLGNRSALEWILDQYKEKKPKDPTIREKFDTYRFADYKEKVIDLLMRVTRVSVKTQAIVEAMKGAAR